MEAFMKKKFIALLLVTATMMSACGKEEEPEEEDVEIEESEDTPKSDSISDEEDNSSPFGLGDSFTSGDEAATTSEAPANAEAQAQTTGTAVADTQAPEEVTDADISVERSDVNENLWIITNNSFDSYEISAKPEFTDGYFYMHDNCFSPGEKLYYFVSKDIGDLTKESFEVYTTPYELGALYDTQCGVVTVSFDSSKYDGSSADSDGYGIYALDDVWEAYSSKIVYEEPEQMMESTCIVYFRLFDADGNVIYEPADCAEEYEMTGTDFISLYEGLHLDASILSSWDHAELYLKTNY
jgi:hypothetical protein